MTYTRVWVDLTKLNLEAITTFNKGFTMRVMLLTVMLIMTPVANACYGDLDCNLGSVCARAWGNTGDGQCVEQRHPTYGTPNSSPRDQVPCQFDTQCGANGRCLTQDGDIKGFCVKEW